MSDKPNKNDILAIARDAELEGRYEEARQIRKEAGIEGFGLPGVVTVDSFSSLEQQPNPDGLDEFLGASDDLIPFNERVNILSLNRTFSNFIGMNERPEYVQYITALASKAEPLIRM